jgi:hypothetical protein
MEITSGGTAAPRLASVFAVRDNNVYGSLSGDMRRRSGLRLGRQRLYQRQAPLDVAARAEARSPVGGSMADGMASFDAGPWSAVKGRRRR